ncbi:MAG: amidohydrolase [Chloroflexi bacterium]|nr:amidohydrolase [Chloroflexota bacterium]
MIIDFHTHVFSPRIAARREAYLRRDPGFAELYSDPEARIATAEDLIVSMDEAGVDASVILNFGWSSQQLCRETNDYIIDCVQRYPGRFIGFFAVQPRTGNEAIAEIERCAAAGLRGIGELRPDSQGFDLGDEATMGPIVEPAKRHELVLLTHASEPVGHGYPGKGEVTVRSLYRFATAFPEARLVCAHWGGGLPFYALMPEVAAALRNTWFDTAASLFLYKDDIFRHVSGILGPDKILLGTDYPLIDQERFLRRIRALGRPAADEVMILGGNAAELLGLW